LICEIKASKNKGLKDLLEVTPITLHGRSLSIKSPDFKPDQVKHRVRTSEFIPFLVFPVGTWFELIRIKK